MLQGKWTYRSVRTTAELVTQRGDGVARLVLFEGVLDLVGEDARAIRGAFGAADGCTLTARGGLLDGATDEFGLVAEGAPGTASDGWRWELQGVLASRWAHDLATPTLLGVVRHSGPGVAHDERTATFVAVAQSNDPPTRTTRLHTLLHDL